MIVEDNSANLSLSTFLLESAGHTVLSTSSAEGALGMARVERPGLILMDIQLPGMNGLEATALLKGDTATRYKTSAAVGREITTFDRHTDFAPGVNYKLSRVSPGSKLGKRADFKTTNGPHKTTREPVARVHKGPVYASAPVKPKGTNHLTSDVRVMRSKSPARA